MSVQEELELKDIPFSGNEQSGIIIQADKPNSSPSERLFSLSTEAEIEANENFIFVDATKTRDDRTELKSQQISNVTKQSKGSTKASRYGPDMGSTSPSSKASKLSFKESIFNYWNSIFKRRQSTTSTRANNDSNKALDDKAKSDEKLRDGEKLNSKVLESLNEVSKLVDEPSGSRLYSSLAKKDTDANIDFETQQASTSKTHYPGSTTVRDECAEWKAQLANESVSEAATAPGRLHLISGKSGSMLAVPPSQSFTKQSMKDSIAMYWKSIFKNRHSSVRSNKTNTKQQLNNKENEHTEKKLSDEEDMEAEVLKRAVQEDH